VPRTDDCNHGAEPNASFRRGLWYLCDEHAVLSVNHPFEYWGIRSQHAIRLMREVCARRLQVASDLRWNPNGIRSAAK
jgi:hypothetical protein